MGRSRAGAAAVAAIAIVAFVLSACSSGGSPADDATTPAEATTAAEATGPSPYLLTRTAMKAGATARTDVGPRRGGTLTVDLPSGAIATLTFEAGAVDARTTMSMTAFTADGVEGVQLEPAGTWLKVPASLVFTNTTKTAAIRVGSAADGTPAFAAPATDAAGAVIVVRLRPVPLLDPAVGPLPAASAVASGPTTDAEQGGDPLDGRAADQEAEEADSPGDDTGGDAVAQEAAGRVAQLAPECGPDVPQSAAQALEAWRSAGSVGAPPIDCVRLAADVLASIEIEWKGFPSTFQEVVRARGTGQANDGIADLDLPAEREVSGIDAMASYLNTTIGIGLAQGLTGTAHGAQPSEDTCHLGSVPQGSVRLEAVPLPGDRIRVTLTPRHGNYTINCDGMPPAEVDATVWDYLRDVLGLGEGEPIVVTMGSGERVEHVLSSVRSVEGARARPSGDGGITVKVSGFTLQALLDVRLAYVPAS